MWKFWTMPEGTRAPPKPLWERAAIAFERPHKPNSDAPARAALVAIESITVGAPTFFTARAFARGALRSDRLLDEVVTGKVEPDVFLRVVGDYNHGATPGCRRLQLRRRGVEEWEDFA
jgi:hypothetical protein